MRRRDEVEATRSILHSVYGETRIATHRHPVSPILGANAGYTRLVIHERAVELGCPGDEAMVVKRGGYEIETVYNQSASHS